MIRTSKIVFFLFCFLSQSSSIILTESIKAGVDENTGLNVLPNLIVIKFKQDFEIQDNSIQTASQPVNELLNRFEITSLERVTKKSGLLKQSVTGNISNIYLATYSGTATPFDLSNELSDNSYIEYAEPHYIHYISAIPDDSLYQDQSFYYDLIQAQEAWDIIKGEDGEVIIAVVDGGTDIYHPDLAANIWINEDEIPGNRKDDDLNGKVDDVYGWNFPEPRNPPIGSSKTPKNADHGTFTAGIISAVSNNGVGVSGVSWNTKIMAINAGAQSPSDDGKIIYGYEGIIYAAENGADIINCSWGENSPSKFGRDVTRYASALGAVIISAAGNNHAPVTDYPAAYGQVLAVAGTDRQDNKLGESNYGAEIDIAAPGEQIVSI